MAALSNHIKRELVTFGNFPMVAPGIPVFKKAGRKPAYDLVPGQLVSYVIENGTTRTVDATTITAADLHTLMIGVGHDSTGNGVVDSIRHMGMEDINGCNLEQTSTSSPSCGSPEVHDFFFDCTKCDETYTVMVTVDDNGSRSFAPMMKSGVDYIGSMVTECHTCDDCPVEHNCKEIACKLATALNGDVELKIGDEAYPDWKHTQGVEKPFFATRLHEKSLIYCLAPSSGDCDEGCNHFSAITDVTVLGETLELAGNVNPADPTQTLIPQLHSIVDQINEAYKAAGGQQGSAYVTGGGQSDCCPIQIHVNTCDDTFAIGGLTPTVEENPFEAGAREKTSDCIDCGEEPTTQEFNCGIRIIAAPLKGECGCTIQQPLSFYGRMIEVKPIGEGWSHGYWRVKKTQDLQLPSGFGSWIQYLELRQSISGDGRQYRGSNYRRGWLGDFDKSSRVNGVTASCPSDYCSFRLVTSHGKNNLGTKGEIKIYSNVHIPTTSDVTIAAWADFHQKLIELSPQCKPLNFDPCITNKDFCDPAGTADIVIK